MITPDIVNYEIIGIAFPKTNAYESRLGFGKESTANFVGINGKSSYNFPWGSFGVEARPDQTELNVRSFESRADAKTILEKDSISLKSNILDPLKPNILELQGKNYPGLEGLVLTFSNNSYLVSALDNSDPFKRQPLEMLDSFKGRTYLDLNDDLNALNRLEIENSKKDNFRRPNALYGLSTIGELSELAMRLSAEGVGGTKLWLYGRNLDEGYSAGIKLLDQLYGLRTPLEKILA